MPIPPLAATRTPPLELLLRPRNPIRPALAAARPQLSRSSHARARAHPGRPVRQPDRRQVLGGHLR
eukprot:14895300-Alexandrium_andersonii.AAC.1